MPLNAGAHRWIGLVFDCARENGWSWWHNEFLKHSSYQSQSRSSLNSRKKQYSKRERRKRKSGRRD
jgi:hypothetical protein